MIRDFALFRKEHLLLLLVVQVSPFRPIFLARSPPPFSPQIFPLFYRWMSPLFILTRFCLFFFFPPFPSKWTGFFPPNPDRKRIFYRARTVSEVTPLLSWSFTTPPPLTPHLLLLPAFFPRFLGLCFCNFSPPSLFHQGPLPPPVEVIALFFSPQGSNALSEGCDLKEAPGPPSLFFFFLRCFGSFFPPPSTPGIVSPSRFFFCFSLNRDSPPLSCLFFPGSFLPFQCANFLPYQIYLFSFWLLRS